MLMFIVEHPDSIPFLYNNVHNFMEVQSSEVHELTKQVVAVKSEDQIQQNFSYVEETAGTKVEYNPITDNTFYASHKAGVELADFLSRPVLIHTENWTEGSSLNTFLNPWELFFDDTRIKKKLDNYAYLSCNLKIKLMVNASPFYYGMGLLSYRPLPEFNPAAIAGSGSTDLDLIPQSQRPHVWFYPQSCQGGELTLPFLYHKDWLRVGLDEEFVRMGQLHLRSVDVLQNANSVAGSNVSISIYAWAEDVCLTGPTVSLALQSEERDEYDTQGMISAPATTISKVAAMLSNIPYIGPFARATSMVSSSIGTIASAFGYTNVPVITDVQPYKNLLYHSMATSEIGQPTDKLTLDPKNELAIDPRVCGVDPHDELALLPLLQRESFITSFAWNESDNTDDIIWGVQNRPDFGGRYSSAGVDYVFYTPLAYFGSLFSYWRGDITYRFRFIATKFHKGRVRITFDPFGDITTDPTTSTVCYTQIVDLSENPDVEITVPYMQDKAWLDTSPLPPNFNWAFGGLPPSAYGNGTLTMRVLNKLTGPAASATIRVVVSVKAGDNFQYAAPRDLDQDLVHYAIQSSEEIELDKPQQIVFGQKTEDDVNLNLVYQGEIVSSLRQLMRRRSLSMVNTGMPAFTATQNYAQYNVYYPRYPLFNGYDINGYHEADDTLGVGVSRYNFVTNHPVNWISQCFVGQRGSMNWSFLSANCVTAVEDGSKMQVSRVVATRGGASHADYWDVEQYDSTANNSVAARALTNENVMASASGISLTKNSVQPGLNAELPMYSKYRMMRTDPLSRSEGASNDGSNVDTMKLTVTARFNSISAPSNNAVFGYCGIGTDYNCIFFLNCPTIIYSTTPPAATS